MSRAAAVQDKERLTFSEFVELNMVVAMLNSEDILKCKDGTGARRPTLSPQPRACQTEA